MSEQERDKRPYFVLTNEYPRHRKIRPLSDKAFRLHVTLMGMCNEDRNDGIIAKTDLQMLGIKAGKEILEAGLVHEYRDGKFQLHDYLDHQRSAAQIAAAISERSESGRRGGLKSNHTRNHVNKGIVARDCELCPGDEPPPED